MSRNVPLVIGLTGANASGKSTAASCLVEHGFTYHSLSDIVREEALARGLTTARNDLIVTGNRLRRAKGPGVLAERTIPRIKNLDVIDSIRNPAEVASLRAVPGFVLLGVWASPTVRFNRARLRKGRGDAVANLSAFLAKEAEENTADPDAQRLEATFALADHVIKNDGSLQDLRLAVEEVLRTVNASCGTDIRSTDIPVCD